jgi:prepilin-type N-terminal cleavage/methylation domain-containing protein
MKGSRAFTLLEVMVAVTILSLSMASLFSAQTGSIGATQYIKHITVASQLGRCKMSELELLVLREGFETAEFGDWTDGPCCELRDERVRIDGPDPFTCRWRFETVRLPSISDAQTAAGEAAMEGDAEAAEGAMGMSLLGPLLPIVQTLLEAAIRRVSVQVVWEDGPIERNVELVQYITNPNQGELGGLLRGNQVQEIQEELGGGPNPPQGPPNNPPPDGSGN